MPEIVLVNVQSASPDMNVPIFPDWTSWQVNLLAVHKTKAQLAWLCIVVAILLVNIKLSFILQSQPTHHITPFS